MNNNMFKVVYTGQLKEAVDIQKVAEIFAKKFKLTPEKALKILKSGKEVTLVKKAEHVKAYKLKAMFEEMGMIAKLERVVLVVAKAPSEKIEVPVDEKPNDNKANNDDSVWSIDDSQVSDDAFKVAQPTNTSKQIITSTQVETQKSATTAVENNNVEIDNEPQEGFIKRFGKLFIGLGAGLLLLLKKFGLFKLLKIGAFVAVGSAIGFDSEVACMGNSVCEEAVEDQVDDCWEKSGLEDLDFDNMSEEEYYVLKPKIENDFIGCLKNPTTGERIFNQPIELRFMLVDFCETAEMNNCNGIIESQIKGCYERYNLANYFNENTIDYYEAMEKNAGKIEKFYNCFVDADGDSISEYIYDDE